MIYIPRDESKIPAEWLARAKRLMGELDAIQDPEERKEFINAHSPRWREIKDNLLEMSHGKC
jgi:hypothetical protein